MGMFFLICCRLKVKYKFIKKMGKLENYFWVRYWKKLLSSDLASLGHKSKFCIFVIFFIIKKKLTEWVSERDWGQEQHYVREDTLVGRQDLMVKGYLLVYGW